MEATLLVSLQRASDLKAPGTEVDCIPLQGQRLPQPEARAGEEEEKRVETVSLQLR